MIKDGVATLGYCINPKYWNKGVMIEVVTEIMRFGFEELNVDKVIAVFHDGNDKSGKVMSKCNMRYIGSEEKEIRLQVNMVNGKIHKYELTKNDYYKN